MIETSITSGSHQYGAKPAMADAPDLRIRQS
jgi:hypothetical protein